MNRKNVLFQQVLGLLLLFLGSIQGALAVERAIIDGTVLFEGTPVCAMVLANGSSMFSCSGNGSYELDVPLDGNGEITLFSFAAGFAPFKQVLTPVEAVNYTVDMARDAGSPTLDVVQNVTSTVPGDRAAVSGTVDFNGTPVCAFILANGQSMFSCGGNLGEFNLEVPLDSSGNISLFVFASGFKPFNSVFSAPYISESEYNDDPEYATHFYTRAQGSLSNSSDIDWFSIDVNEPSHVEVTFDTSSMNFGIFNVYWYSPSLETLSGRNMGPSLDSSIFTYSYPAYTPGKHYVRVQSLNSTFYNGGRYYITLNITPK